MEVNLRFVDYFSAITGIVAFLIMLIKILFALTYSEIDKIIDNAEYGATKTWRVWREIIVVIFCLSWFLARNY